MNAVVEAQWTLGLPPHLYEDITWRRYGGGPDVGLVGRRTLIDLKLFAAVVGVVVAFIFRTWWLSTPAKRNSEALRPGS